MSNITAGCGVRAVSVVVPCLDEEDNVVPVYQEIIDELGELDLEVIYVDDGSTDATLERIRALAGADPRVRFVSFTRNFGFEAAFSAGYRYARHGWILHLDADQQFPAAEARKLIAAAESGHDAVFGIRADRQDPLPRRWGTAVFQFVARRLLRIDLPEGATAFRLVRADLAREIVGLRLGTPYFLATVPRLTNRYTSVPVAHRPRLRGESKVRLGFLVTHAVELFVGHTRRLLTAASVAALGAGSGAVLLGAIAATGLLGGRLLATAEFALLATVLFVLSLLMRYMVVVGANQPRPQLYYIREANLPVDPRETLCSPPVSAAPPTIPQQADKPVRETPR